MTETQVLLNLKFEIGQFKWRARRQNLAVLFFFICQLKSTHTITTQIPSGFNPDQSPLDFKHFAATVIMISFLVFQVVS